MCYFTGQKMDQDFFAAIILAPFDQGFISLTRARLRRNIGTQIAHNIAAFTAEAIKFLVRCRFGVRA